MGVATLSAPARKRLANRKERRELKSTMALEIREHRADQEEELELFKRDQVRQRARHEKEQEQARLQREAEDREFNKIMTTFALESLLQMIFGNSRRKLIFEGISSITEKPFDNVTVFNREVALAVQHLGPLNPAEFAAYTRTLERISEREVKASEKKASRKKSAIAVG